MPVSIEHTIAQMKKARSCSQRGFTLWDAYQEDLKYKRVGQQLEPDEVV